MVSQYRRHLGDRREHDEGELKRKERVPEEEEKNFERHLARNQAMIERLKLHDNRIQQYGLGEMARTLRTQLVLLRETVALIKLQQRLNQSGQSSVRVQAALLASVRSR